MQILEQSSKQKRHMLAS